MKIKKSPVFILIYLLVCFSAVPQAAETTKIPLPTLSAEAPKSFSSAELGSADVELFIQGYWEAVLTTSGTFSFGSPLPAQFNPVPLLFQQRPDLYILLILQKQWWAEVSVTEEISRTLFALGYSGLEDDFLKEVRLGNSGISMRDYPNMAFGTTKNAFGIRAQAEDLEKGIFADAMIRWDSLSFTTKRFLGTLALEENAYPASNWLRGRRFVLPNVPVVPISNLVLREVYNGNTRILGSEEYSLRNAYGFVELVSEPAGMLYADYTDGGVPHLNEKLYEKNTDNPNEAKNLYAIAAGSNSSDYFIRSRKTNLPDTSYSIRIVGPSLLEITKGENPGYSTPEFMTPFSTAPDFPDLWIYKPIPENTANSYPPAASFEIASRSFKETSGIQIEQNALAGSISILRNGIATTQFSYDPNTGAVNLLPPPGAGEEIIIRYALEASEKGSNGLLFGFGMGWRQGDTARWQAAIGGRWPFPGQSYAEAGQQHPSWLGLSLAAESPPDPVANFSWSSSIFGRLVRPEASGIYRIAGMEDAIGYISPFRPISGDTVNIKSVVAVDSTFPAAWPEYDKKVHKLNEKSGSLRFTAETGATGDPTRFVNYQEPVPLALYKNFVFFMRNVSSSAATLTLHVGDESSGLTVTNLNIDDIPDEWIRVEVTLQDLPQIHASNSRGETVALTVGSVTYQPTAAAGFVYMDLVNFSDGVFWIDELHLEDPYAGFNSELKGFVQLRSETAPEDVFTNASATAAVGSAASEQWTFSLNSDLGAGFYTGPARWRINLKPVFLEDSFYLGTSYDLMVPRQNFPLRYNEYFFRQPANQLFAHKLQATIAASPFQASLIQETVDSSYLFSQTWLASVTMTTWINLKINALNYLPFTLLGTKDIPETWMESWKFLVPRQEAEASKRSLGLDLELAPRSAVKLSANQIFESRTLSESLLNGRISWPLKIGVPVFTPFYERNLHVFDNSYPDSFTGDGYLWLDTVENCWPLVIEYPFQDFYDEKLADSFEALCSGYEKADFSTGTGMSIERPIGYGSIDLWLPAKAQAAITRKLQKSLDTYTDSMVYDLRLEGSAFNVFSRNGVKPVFDSFDLDEYLWRLNTRLSHYSTDPRFFPSVNGEYSVSLSTEMGSTLSAKIQGKYEESRTGIIWEAGAGISDNKKMTRTWVSELIKSIKSKERVPRDPKAAKNTNIVWSWFDGMASEIPLLRDIWSADFRLTYAENEITPCIIKLSERYESKYNIAQSLSLAAFVSLNQSINIHQSYVLWGFGYELGMNARVSF